MSALEKFGILVILVLVVVIGVVAVWGGGGAGTMDPFDDGAVAAVPDAPTDGVAPPMPEYPASGVGPAPASDAPVAPPGLASVPTPAAPPVAPVPAPAPAAVARTYKVQPGDTLSKIAGVVYGDRNAWHRLVSANPGVNPKNLKIGQELVVPAEGAASAFAPPAPAPAVDSAPRPNVSGFRPNPADGPTGSGAAATTRTVEYEVKSGDTLIGIAASNLHDKNLWTKIRDLNPDVNPSRLRPGQRIKLPAAE
jgi:nucleoid-associated protein YgaU